MANLHDRQPIILDPAAYDAWLDPATPTSACSGAISVANCNSTESIGR
ncbi:SOS response-associated peptidase family protein [Mesorhizobium sp.]|nr:SOS response-associated peptidase family protein [Mesorhizobium sp.]RWC39349.1 MAG: hypothetical protein EOS28_26865 [Mesorhizobium sp.]RWF04474.1 MAG: hypothetical protein EOS68_02360 [Mesorhizobium sp.]